MTMTKAHLRIIISSPKKAGAEKILSRLQSLVGLEVLDFGPYDKGGFEVNATIHIPASAWPEMILSAFTIVQQFGYTWTLSGDITEGIEISCDRFKIQGLEYAGLHLQHP